jgi:glucokinase
VKPYAIGIDLGGTNVKTVAVTAAGKILREDHFGTQDDSAARWMDATRAHVASVEQALGPASCVGVASPGLAARDERSIAWMMGRLDAVMGLDWTQHLERTKPVPVLNDAHAALVGETWLGAAAGARDVVMLTLGTGVGGAILCDVRILKGHLGRAGHLGHMSLDPNGVGDIVGAPGSIEDAIGECTLAVRGGGAYASTKDLVAAYRAGDEKAAKIWLTSVRALAAAIASIINAVDPEIVLLGGGISRANDALLNPLNKFLDQFECRPTNERVQIEFARLGDRAGALGAAKYAWEKLST